MATPTSHGTDTSLTQAGIYRWLALWRRMPALVLLCLLALAVTPAASRAAESPGTPGVFAWGENEVGQLGDGNTTETDAPVAVPGLGEATTLSMGRKFGLALLTDGTVKSWGENVWGQLGDDNDTGPETCHANFAQASGYEVPCSTTPVPVAGLSDVTAVAAGAQHGLALLSNGTVMAWGDNEDGQLGDGTGSNSDVPVTVHGLSEVVAITADQNSSLALLKNGTVMSWGYDGEGALGQGSDHPSQYLPAPVSGLTNAKAIAGNHEGNLALLADGTVVAWGENFFGELGDGTMVASSVPVAVSDLSDVRAIAAGGDSLALRADGTVMAWGSNNAGQLGIGTIEGPTECFLYNFCGLTPVPLSELKGVSAIAAGYEHNLALLSDREVVAWGENWNGQLGTGDTVSTDGPVPVPGLIDVSEIAAGEGRSFAYGVLGETQPEVSELSPVSGSQMGGTVVTIKGKNFVGATAVKFGTQDAASYTVDSDETITALSPPGTGVVSVTVTSRYGSSASEPADFFAYGPVAQLSSAQQRPRPRVRLISARLHGSVLLLSLEGACASCKMRLTITAVPSAGDHQHARAGDAAHVSPKREPPHSKRTAGGVQTKIVMLTGAKKRSLKFSLDAAARALLHSSRKLALTVQCNEGATLVMKQTLRLKASRPDR
jgi:alpha-tubulin suppressor-like RCC1 family protein